MPGTSSDLPLVSGEDQRALDAAQQFAAEGAAGVPSLLALFTHRSWVVRRRVVEALSRGDRASLEALSRALAENRSHEPTVAGIVDALSAASSDAVPLVRDLLHHPEPAVLCDAIQIMGRREEHASVARLAELTRHPNDNVALAALEALGRLGGSEAVDVLIAVAQEDNFFRVFPAIDGLGRSHDVRALPTLQKLLLQPLYATEAARALGRIGNVSAVAPLVRALHTPSDALLRIIALSLTAIEDSLIQSVGKTTAVRRLVREHATDSLRERITRALVSADANEKLALGRLLAWLGSERSIDDFVSLLNGTDDMAALAVDALGELGALTDPRVLELVKNGSSSLRSRLLPALSGAAGAESAAVLCLDDDAPGVRALACHLLARSNFTAAVPRLFELLMDSDLGVVHAAVSAIQSLGSAETERLALAAARSEQPAERRAGLRIVLYFGYKESLALALEALESTDERLRDIALAGLPVLDDPRVLTVLVRAATHSAARTRSAAVRALSQLPAIPETVQVLRTALEDQDAWVRYYACQSLGRLRIDTALPLLVAKLDDPAGQVQTAAVEALAAIPGPAATEALALAATSSNLDVRRAAVVGIGARRDETLRPALLNALTSPDSALRLGAISSLARFDAAEPELERTALHDTDAVVRRAAIELLGSRDGELSTRALLRLLERDPKSTEVMSALSQRVAVRIPELLLELERADEAMGAALLQVLSHATPDAHRAALEAAFASTNPPARRATARVLSLISDDWAKSILARAALSDVDPEVRRLCAAAIA